MEYLPLHLSLRQRPVLVVGGGVVASRKALLLLEAGAVIEVLSPALVPSMQTLLTEEKIRWRPGYFADLLAEGQIKIADYALILAATDDALCNQAVYQAAHRQNIPVNVADQPDLCDFILPAIVERGRITVSISTGGRSPVLARVLKNALEVWLPRSLGQLADFLEEKRTVIKSCLTSQQRRKFWQKLLFDNLFKPLWREDQRVFSSRFQEVLENFPLHSEAQGRVDLVGAGPGDPELLTFKALRLIEQADVIVHDQLVNPAILALGRREAERIDVGKRKNKHKMAQEDINTLLINLAKQGLQVVRLKGGDPFIFGRGGEEIMALRAANIPFGVVPGITAASGCAASAAMPLTHRDYAHGCRFLTAQKDAEGQLNLPWSELAHSQDSLVFYMGGDNLSEISNALLMHGMAEDMPMAWIENGTLDNEKVYVSTLKESQTTSFQRQGPCLVLIGRVVALTKTINTIKSACLINDYSKGVSV